MKKQMLFKTKGMNQDLSVSAFNPEFSFENMNLRLSTNEGNTLMSWVNEKGTAELIIVTEDVNGQATQDALTITGTPIGTAIINSYLILFTKGTTYDYIYRLKYTNNTKTALQGKVICKSVSQYMTLSVNHPLETLVSYESDTIQKVYWVDGINQPRVINICKDYGVIASEGYCKFDFVPELQLQETVTVQKLLGATGMFAPGVIQYAFTYYNKNGQESNIFYTTPLYYISYKDRGASPEDKVENAFKIKVKGVDRHFEYLRIYSIQRTSVNATPICKRIQDIELNNSLSMEDDVYVAYYTDNGFSGNTIDPTELLYKGGETVIAQTIEQKDNTLFMGNIKIQRTENWETLKNKVVYQGTVGIAQESRTFYPTKVSTYNYVYSNQLTAFSDSDKKISVPCGGFKVGDYYRCGIQFQHKNGKWSDPIFVHDQPIVRTLSGVHYPYSNSNTVVIPTLRADLHTTLVNDFYDAGYRKVRAVVVFPEMQDRVCLCQGVVNPTVYTSNQRNLDQSLTAQSSWFFRPHKNQGTGYSPVNSDGSVMPKSYGTLEYADKGMDTNIPSTGDTAWNPKWIKQVEIQGHFDSGNKFGIDRGFLTFHSPEVEFDDRLSLMDFEDVTGCHVGNAVFSNTFSDIDIQTETPTVSNAGSGFVHKSFNKSGTYGIVAGLFYDDFILDDWSDRIGKDDDIGSPYKWFVFPWHKTGSLNNDCTRPADKGTQTAKLKKKVISNLRFAGTTYMSEVGGYYPIGSPQLFSSDEVSIVKLGNDIYQGNIDTSLTPDNADGVYCAFSQPNDMYKKDVITPFSYNTLTGFFKTYSKSADTAEDEGLYSWSGSKWQGREGHFGDCFVDIVMKKEPVRMKYKSTPHLIFKSTVMDTSSYTTENGLPIMEVRRDLSGTKQAAFEAMIFGGQSDDAKKENNWVPCGEPVQLVRGSQASCKYSYGDTYYQRWDCLKTYAFTKEDINQVVEIGSFMLETKVNIDGRYDRNRGQMNNLNMSPQNFNLFNPVYNQVDNFFSYKIQDDDSYQNLEYPNQLTWSKTKENTAEIDLWTNVTLASVLELDGDKGKINKLIRLNNQLFCFQDTGISHILYNENVQIQTTQGVPVELANSGKVQGKDYKSNTIGCSNKWSMVTTPSGIYFMDSNDKSIYLFNGQLNNVSASGGFNAWCKNNIPASSIAWTPTDFNTFKACYDRLNQDVLFINKTKALAFSEKLGAFTSFYSYENTPFLCNLDDTGIWIKAPYSYTDAQEQTVSVPCKLWKHQAGSYCQFFGANNNKPYWITLVGNPEPQMDKIFTNIEFRACVDSDGELNEETGKFTPTLPFDSLETWDEYQHGIANLSIRNGHNAFKHHTTDNNASLKRKFRIWRCDIPRDNAPLASDAALNVTRFRLHPNDRMRNTWLYLKLKKDAATTGSLARSEIHDVMMTYFV